MAWTWPWARPEVREGYTSQVLGLQYAAATGSGSLADAAASTALERASGLWAGALAVADVEAPTVMRCALGASWRAQMVRDLLRHGEHLAVIGVGNGRLTLTPASNWTVRGDPDPASWLYDVTLSGPSTTTTKRVPAAGVVHVQWSRRRITPWIGCGPLANCGLSARILGALDRRLGDRAVQPTGGFLPVPRHDVDPDDEDAESQNNALGTDIEAASGRLLIVESTAGGDGDRAMAPQRDFNPTSFGLDVPEAAAKLRDDIEAKIFSSCGIPIGLGEASTGASVNALYRQWIFTGVQGLAAQVAGELTDKLETDISFSFLALGHIPVAERAAAIARLVDKAKLPVADARAAVRL